MRVILETGPVYTGMRFTSTSYSDIASVTQAVRVVTQARPSGYQYMPSYKSGKWDGFICLCKGSRFPTGLVQIVVGAIRAVMPDIEIVNYNKPDMDCHAIKPDMFTGITLRPYQINAARLCLSYGRGVLKMATNSGKTEVIAALAKAIGGGMLVLTTKKDLLHQTAERFENRLQERIGLVGDGHWDVQRVTVGMVQTLSKHLFELSELDNLHVVVFDECHHLPSKTSQAVMYGLSAPYRFGFSGTPLRNDNLSDLILIGATGPVLLEVTNADLIESGISARPVVDMHTIDGSMHYNAKWQEAYSLCIVHNDIRNALIQNCVVDRKAASTLILIERIEHGKILQDKLASLSPLYVNGSSDMDTRRVALDVLRAGDGAVVIATNIFDEGVDVPAVDLLVLAGGGKGHIRLLQRLGRGMRRKESRNVLSVVDFVDDTNMHLLKHSLARARIYEQEGFEINMIENASSKEGI